MHDVGLLAGPPDPHRALAVHPGAVAPEAGCLHRHALPDDRSVGVDGEAGGVAGGFCAEDEMAGGLVEIRVGGEGVGGLRRGRAVQGGGEEEGEGGEVGHQGLSIRLS